jgi:hypothetical protein
MNLQFSALESEKATPALVEQPGVRTKEIVAPWPRQTYQDAQPRQKLQRCSIRLRSGG